MKIIKSLLTFCLYFIFLFIFYLIHIKFFRVDVIFYSAIFDGVLAAVVATIIIFKIKYFDSFNSFEKFQMSIIWLLSGYIFAISVPTVLDRSLSFYILEKIQQRGGGIQLSSVEEIFTREYVKEHRLVDVRLTEQQSSGTILISNGCIKLTKRGKHLATFSRYFRQNFLPKQRLLNGEYTDDLTNPFRNSEKIVDYECK